MNEKANAAKILEGLRDSVLEYNSDKAVAFVQRAIKENIDPLECADALIAAIREVGDKYGRGELFLPDLVAAAEVLEKTMPILEREIEKRGERLESLGTVVIGTVFGDIHNIGKTLVAALLTAAGFKVIDLGVNVKASEFIEAVKKYKPDILAMSALLTTTAPEQGRVIKELKSEGLRDKVKVIVGGGPITREFAEAIGADGYAPTAPEAVKLAKEILKGGAA